jgi:hypothetical protein
MVSSANLSRLERSLAKLRERENLDVSDDDIATLRDSAADKLR